MNKEIFVALKGIEEEAENILSQAQRDVALMQEEANQQAAKVAEKVRQRIEGLKQNVQKESQAENARLREDASQKLEQEVSALNQRAQSAMPAAVASVVKECLTHGHR